MARRPQNVFALSFLDCISCGFGALILVFVIISARVNTRSEVVLESLDGEALRLEARSLAGHARLEDLEARLSEKLGEQVAAQAQVLNLSALLQQLRASFATLSDDQTARAREIERIKRELQALEIPPSEPEETKDRMRQIRGEGDRQYLTGLKMGGRRILIMVDASASMLDRTIVNVIRRRNMSVARQKASRKWKQAVATVDWLAAQMPPTSEFQIYTFNVKAAPLVEGSRATWLPVGEGDALDRAVTALHEVVPKGGTSLHAAFTAISRLKPRPDNLYLLVDGLPTQGSAAPKDRIVSGRARLAHFRDAVRKLPLGIPVNVILYPMEGDPMALPAFWELAHATKGSLLSPSEDWP